MTFLYYSINSYSMIRNYNSHKKKLRIIYFINNQIIIDNNEFNKNFKVEDSMNG